MTQSSSYEPWPELPYDKFASTGYLLHSGVQALGKLKLTTPFEPHWANVALWLTTRGLTTGLIPYGKGCFSVNLDLLLHEVICTTTWGTKETFKFSSMSVAQFTEQLFATLHKLGIDIKINMMPQEVDKPIAMNQDNENRNYDPALANAWWRILISSYRVLQRYHARFTGYTPPIGLMWGTFDLRDARYIDGQVPGAAGKDFITRNAYDAPQVEAGWWSGDPTYTRAAYYSLIFPVPAGVESAKIKPAKAHWDAGKQIFVLDYDDVRLAKHPEDELLTFFQSTYEVSTERAGWDNAHLVCTGEPV